jgi:hypothetical protein
MSAVIESMWDERDVETPTVEAPALDTWVVEDGDVMDAEHERSYPADCFCEDGRHREIDREQVAYPNSRVHDGAHRITVHLYSVTSAENDMTPDDLEAPMQSRAKSEAELARRSKAMRDKVEARYPGEMGKSETDIGKAIKKMLGIDGSSK